MTEQAAAPKPAASTGRLVIQAALRTDVGLVRSENQDFGTYTTPQEEKDASPGGRLLVVADGMGGHRGGATASRLAAETVKAQYLGSDTNDVPEALRDALLRANARIYHEAQANPDLRGMGTTTSALAVRGNHAWFAHVGDSRIYRIRRDQIEQLTEDHSLVATMVREGLLTTKEAENHPRRNVLQRSMGVAEDVEVDVRGPYPVEDGDTFILCSDGLHGLVKEDEMREVAKLPIDEAADEFLRRALQRGAPDNVTVIVARAVRTEAGDDDVTIVGGPQYAPRTQPQPHADDVEQTQPIPPEKVAAILNTAPDLGSAVAAAQTPQPADDFHTRDTAKVPAITLPAETAAPDVAAAEPEPVVVPPSSPLPRVLWVFAVIVAAVAAGAWFLWFTR